jgi:hypothetical protein
MMRWQQVCAIGVAVGLCAVWLFETPAFELEEDEWRSAAQAHVDLRMQQLGLSKDLIVIFEPVSVRPDLLGYRHIRFTAVDSNKVCIAFDVRCKGDAKAKPMCLDASWYPYHDHAEPCPISAENVK